MMNLKNLFGKDLKEEVLGKQIGQLNNNNISTYSQEVVKKKIEELMLDSSQPRKSIDAIMVDGFARSIEANGVLQPLLCQIDQEGKVVVVDGSMRLLGAKKAGLKDVPCIFVKGRPGEIALTANLLREDLTPVELAESMQKVMLLYDLTHDDLANIINKARSTVTEILSINKLPKEIRDECRGERKIKQSTLIDIAKAPTEKSMIKKYESIKNKMINESGKKSFRNAQHKEKIDLLKASVQGLIKRLQPFCESDNLTDTANQLKEDLISLQSLINKLITANGAK